MSKPAPAVHVHVPLPRPGLELACELAKATGRDVIAAEVHHKALAKHLRDAPLAMPRAVELARDYGFVHMSWANDWSGVMP